MINMFDMMREAQEILSKNPLFLAISLSDELKTHIIAIVDPKGEVLFESPPVLLFPPIIETHETVGTPTWADIHDIVASIIAKRHVCIYGANLTVQDLNSVASYYGKELPEFKPFCVARFYYRYFGGRGFYGEDDIDFIPEGTPEGERWRWATIADAADYCFVDPPKDVHSYATYSAHLCAGIIHAMADPDANIPDI